MIGRRRFLRLCGGVGALLSSTTGLAQTHRPSRIAALNLIGQPSFCMDSWRTALRELGYVDGDNVQLDIRHVAPDQLSDAVQDIIRWNPDVMVCVSSLQ